MKNTLNKTLIQSESSSAFKLRNEQYKVDSSIQTITLIRGLPGSGKSTLAKKLNAEHVEADMFFIKNGTYCFNSKKIQDAHFWCQAEVKYLLNQGKNVVVSNTFTTIEEMKPYIEVSKSYTTLLKIIECNGNYRSVHAIPAETIIKMKCRWEILPKHLERYLFTDSLPEIYSPNHTQLITPTRSIS